jgi:nuclear transport factor 2 (NTF2) superfamily protein
MGHQVESERPPLPHFTRATAVEKVRMAEDAWNSRNPERVALAYTQDSEWRNRDRFLKGRSEIAAFLREKWSVELGYRLIKELFAFEGNRIAVRFCYEFHNVAGEWIRAYGNENWIFATDGRMARRMASINDLRITEADRRLTFAQGRRPDDFPNLSALGL